jgi:hypothetical protein
MRAGAGSKWVGEGGRAGGFGPEIKLPGWTRAPTGIMGTKPDIGTLTPPFACNPPFLPHGRPLTG